MTQLSEVYVSNPDDPEASPIRLGRRNLLIPGGGGGGGANQGTWAASRNVYDHPFPQDSIWPRPIGQGAQFVDPGFGPPTEGGAAGFYRVQVDDEHHCLNPTAPIKTMSGGGAANGQQVRIDPSDSNNGSLNHCWAYLSPIDNLSVWQGQPLTLSPGGNPSTTNTRPSFRVHLTNSTEDARLGSHGGSGLSAIGGSFRPGDLNGPDPIRHALKLNVYGYKYLSQFSNGYRWPATKADGAYAGTGNGSYQGTVPECRMGALVALPMSYSTAWITHPKVLKIAVCLKHYGAYIVDNTAWDVYAFSALEDVRVSGEFPYNDTGSSDTQTFHSELINLIQGLKVINNNAAGPTAGGGDPVADNLLAPTTFTGLP